MYDFIRSNSYSQMCNYEYKSELTDLPSGLVHCDMCSIPEFFKRINDNGKRYVVISSSSDFGVYYQQQFPVWADLARATQMFVTSDLGYQDLKIASRHEKQKCNIDDKFTIKCYSWTNATFNAIPNNIVHWFVVNCGIREPNVSAIPFGILSEAKLEEEIEKNKDTKRTKGVYVNFQFYTNERYEIFQYLKKTNLDNTTIERDVDFSTFIKRLHEHRFCLCPVGNGADCYRIYEALYSGCIPIIERHPALMSLYGVLQQPMVVLNDLHNLVLYDTNIPGRIPIYLENISLTKWKNIIHEKVNQL